MAESSSTATSASTAAHSYINKRYQVFLNHRGVDVKKTFARDLYNRLIGKGLTAFLDQDELQPGYYFPGQIEDAIKTASVHVAIFSQRYAESSWCLNELLMMLESNAPIIPVFYGVTPAEVRWTQQGKNGNYAQALQNHEDKGRCDSQTIDNWRKALSKVADISGFELEACNIGKDLELEVLDKVVECLSEMVKTPDFHVADYPKGLDDKLNDFVKTVLVQQQQSGKPPIFGIVGLGGVGKTTLAKLFFNKKKLDHHKSCFLFEVKNNKSSLVSLQDQLLVSLTGWNKRIRSVDEGKEMLKEPLKNCNALVILDDVDHVDQVNALLPVQTHDLHSGSLILITSRDQDVLRKSRLDKSSIYTLTVLDTQHSRELFCSHAFSQVIPLPGFESLVVKFLESCKGLPLSLKIVGALLYARDIVEWEDEWESLQQILPGEIHNTFIISYNSLNEEEKQMFLDIACFFNGQTRDIAIDIWNESGWRGRRGLQTLQNKCLVEVDTKNVIHMHDHLRALGTAVEHSPRCRWTDNHINDLFQQSAVINVRGIRMVLSENDDEFWAIGRMTLRPLHTENARIQTENDFVDLILRNMEFSNLMWLRWNNCPYSSLPSWIPMKDLRVLRVSGNTLETLWQDDSQVPLQLKVCLEFWAYNCAKLKSIRGLAQCTQLRKLVVQGCSELEELPSMETLISLEELWAGGCVKLRSIRGLAQCTELRKLVVSNCSELEELPSMETLISLEELWVNGCVKLRSIRGLAQCTQLRKLVVTNCSDLEELPSMERLTSLEELGAEGCVKLRSIRGLAQCTQLRKLDVEGCSELEELPSIERFISLEELWAGECVKLRSIRGLAQCTQLRKLVVTNCSDLEELPSMERLTSLEVLWAQGCVKLRSIRGLAQCTQLRKLSVYWCFELEELPSMETLISLQELWAGGCVKVRSIRGLAQCTNLRKLYVRGCRELEELEDVEYCNWLEEPRLSECPKLQCPVWK